MYHLVLESLVSLDQLDRRDLPNPHQAIDQALVLDHLEIQTYRLVQEFQVFPHQLIPNHPLHLESPLVRILLQEYQ